MRRRIRHVQPLEHLAAHGQQPEPAEGQDRTQDVRWSEMLPLVSSGIKYSFAQRPCNDQDQKLDFECKLKIISNRASVSCDGPSGQRTRQGDFLCETYKTIERMCGNYSDFIPCASLWRASRVRPSQSGVGNPSIIGTMRPSSRASASACRGAFTAGCVETRVRSSRG